MAIVAKGGKQAQPGTIERKGFWAYCIRVEGGTRARARKIGVPHSIDAYGVDRLLVDQQWRCAVSGIPFEQPCDRSTDFSRNPFGPSLDRIVPKLGYVPGNLRVVCTIVNMAINEWGLETFLKLLDAMRTERP